MSYNASVYQKMEKGGSGVFVAEVNENGKMLRSNWIQFTGFEGTEKYDEYIRARFPGDQFAIVKDNCQGYKNSLRGLALPPTYFN